MQPVFILLIAVAIIAATISAIFGLAGGAILFFVISQVMDVKTAIPIHSGVQMIGNFSRVSVFLKSIQWKTVGLFCLLLLPGTLLGGAVYKTMDLKWMEVIVGIFIVMSIFVPKITESQINKWTLVILGFFAGFLGMIVAVTGPFINAFLSMNGLRKENLVATKSVCQGISQLLRIVIFSTMIGFNFNQYYNMIVLLGIGAVAGTFLGKFIIGKISEHNHKKWNNALLLVIALAMILEPIIN